LIGQDRGSIMGCDVSQVFGEDLVQFIQDLAVDQIASGCFAIMGKSCRIKGVGVNSGDSPVVVLAIDSGTE